MYSESTSIDLDQLDLSFEGSESEVTEDALESVESDSCAYSSSGKSATLGSKDTIYGESEDYMLNFEQCPPPPTGFYLKRIEMFYGLIVLFIIWAIVYGLLTHYGVFERK